MRLVAMIRFPALELGSARQRLRTGSTLARRVWLHSRRRGAGKSPVLDAIKLRRVKPAPRRAADAGIGKQTVIHRLFDIIHSRLSCEKKTLRHAIAPSGLVSDHYLEAAHVLEVIVCLSTGQAGRSTGEALAR